MVIFQVQAPGAYIWRGDLTDGFLRYRLWWGGGGVGLIHGGAYFRNFTVYERVEKSFISVWKGQKMHFVAMKKSRKQSGFVIYSYFKYSSFTAVKMGIKVLN